MARCRRYRGLSKSYTLDRALANVKPGQYETKEIVCRIVDVTAYAMSSTFVRWSLAYKRFADKYRVMEFYFITVGDNKGQFQQFHIHPKFLDRVWRGEIRCGELIKIKSFTSRTGTTGPLKHNYFEIASLEVLEPFFNVKQFSHMPWRFNQQTAKDIVQKIRSFVKPVPVMVRLNIWQTAIPVWPKEEPGFSYPLPAKLASWMNDWENIMNKFSISQLNRTWATDPAQPPPLLVRVVCKTKSIYYHSQTVAKPFPVRTMLAVCDGDAACTVVIWDASLSIHVLDKIHTGTILLLHSYNVRPSCDGFIWPNGLEQQICPIEIHIQDQRKFNKQGIIVAPLNFAKRLDTVMPLPYQQFCKFEVFRNAPKDGICNVAGLVTGLSRYCRLRSTEALSDISKLTFRWIEVRDVFSDAVVNVEVFVTSQLDLHRSLCVGDIIAFTFLRVCMREDVFPDERILYLTSCQITEMYVFPKHAAQSRFQVNTPRFVLDEIGQIKEAISHESFQLPLCWVGGPHPYSALSVMCRGCDGAMMLSPQNSTVINGAQISNLLQTLALRESRCVALLGTIVEVTLCSLETFSGETFCSPNGKLDPNCTVLNRASRWYPDKSLAFTHGGHLPFHCSFPVIHTVDNSLLLHNSLEFPLTNIVEIRERQEELENVPLDQSNAVVKKDYFRITLLSSDRHASVDCVFLPMMPYREPISLAELLYMNFSPHLDILESPVTTWDCSPMAMSYLKKSAWELEMAEVNAIIQIYCVGPEEYEFLLCAVSPR